MDLSEYVEKWDVEDNLNNLLATGDRRRKFQDIFDNLKFLQEFKFEPYQPIPHPPEKDFKIRLNEWLEQFPEDQWKFLFFFASKIIFYTYEQFLAIMDTLLERRIKKMVLEHIIFSKNLPPFSYKEAIPFFKTEFQKTLFVGLSDSSRINEFCHRNILIDRTSNLGIELNTLIYPTKRRIESGSVKVQESCSQFEDSVLKTDDVLLGKTRLIIIDDFSGSGSDIINSLTILEKSSLDFQEIIFAPYIITYKAVQNLQKWIEDEPPRKNKFSFTYGSLLEEDLMCFDFTKSYLKSDWFGNEDICAILKQNCEWAFDKIFKSNLDPSAKFGFGDLKIAFVNYYNCPDNTLPILWFNYGKKWKPLFERAKRIL